MGQMGPKTMAQEVIDVGAAANDGTGDTLRAGWVKANANFDELYDAVDDLEGGGALPGIYAAAALGVLPANSGATNSAALQTAIDMISTVGGGSLLFDTGIYAFDQVGESPYNAANTYCVELKSNVILTGRPGTVFQLADDQQTGSADAVHMFVAGTACNNYGFRDVELDFNATGQSGWSGGYSQGSANGCILCTGITGSGGPTSATTNLILENVYAHSAFSSPFELIDVTGARCKNIRVENSGEGMAFTRSSNCHVDGFFYSDPLGVSVGDAFESSDGSHNSLVNFEIRDAAGGSAIDMATPYFRIANGEILDGDNGIVMQPIAGALDQSNPIGTCSNVFVHDMAGDGISVQGNSDSIEADVTISNCVAVNCVRGIVIVKHPSDTHMNGLIHVLNCVGKGCTGQGFLATLVKVDVVGGDYSENSDVGMQFNPVGNTVETQTVYNVSGSVVRGNVNYGVQVVYNATAAPICNIVALCDGNAAGLTFQHQFAEMWTYYPTATKMRMLNLRPYRIAAMALQDYFLTGETRVALSYSGFNQIEGGLDGQFLTLVSTGNYTIQDDAVGGTANLDLLGGVDRACVAGDTTTLQYRAVTQKWKEIARNTVQGAAVADATDAASAITQLNALLSRVRALGLIAT